MIPCVWVVFACGWRGVVCVCFMASAVDIPLFFGLIYTPYTLESDSRYPRVPLFSPLSYHVCHVLDCDSSSSVTPPPPPSIDPHTRCFLVLSHSQLTSISCVWMKAA